MSQIPSIEPEIPKPAKKPGGIGNAFWLLLGLAGVVGIVVMGVILLTPTLANVARDGIVDATTSYKVRSAAAYPNASKVIISDSFRKNYDRTTRGDLVRSWVSNSGVANAQSFADKVNVDFGIFTTSDDISKIEQFYRTQLAEGNFRVFSSTSTGGQDQRGFVSTIRREVIIITVAKPTPDVLNSYARFDMQLPKDRNIMTISSAVF